MIVSLADPLPRASCRAAQGAYQWQQQKQKQANNTRPSQGDKEPCRGHPRKLETPNKMNNLRSCSLVVLMCLVALAHALRSVEGGFLTRLCHPAAQHRGALWMATRCNGIDMPYLCSFGCFYGIVKRIAALHSDLQGRLDQLCIPFLVHPSSTLYSAKHASVSGWGYKHLERVPGSTGSRNQQLAAAAPQQQQQQEEQQLALNAAKEPAGVPYALVHRCVNGAGPRGSVLPLLPSQCSVCRSGTVPAAAAAALTTICQ